MDLLQIFKNSKTQESLGKRIAQSVFAYGLATALLVMPIIGCEKKDSNNNNNNNNSSQTQNNECSEDYFPLHVGNSWTYKRTVNNNARYAYIAAETNIRTGITRKVLSRGIVPSATDGYETYSITKRTGNEFTVDISCKGGRNVLDGKYHFDLLENVIWKYSPGGSYQSVWEIRKGISRGCNIISYGHPFILTPYISMTEDGLIKSSCDFFPETVTVPAGSFDHLWINVIKYNDDSDEMRSFKDIVYLAPGIGMIKKVHYDHRGNEIGRLELTSFQAEGFDRLNF